MYGRLQYQILLKTRPEGLAFALDLLFMAACRLCGSRCQIFDSDHRQSLNQAACKFYCSQLCKVLIFLGSQGHQFDKSNKEGNCQILKEMTDKLINNLERFIDILWKPNLTRHWI